MQGCPHKAGQEGNVEQQQGEIQAGEAVGAQPYGGAAIGLWRQRWRWLHSHTASSARTLDQHLAVLCTLCGCCSCQWPLQHREHTAQAHGNGSLDTTMVCPCTDSEQCNLCKSIGLCTCKGMSTCSFDCLMQTVYGGSSAGVQHTEPFMRRHTLNSICAVLSRGAYRNTGGGIWTVPT